MRNYHGIFYYNRDHDKTHLNLPLEPTRTQNPHADMAEPDAVISPPGDIPSVPNDEGSWNKGTSYYLAKNRNPDIMVEKWLNAPPKLSYHDGNQGFYFEGALDCGLAGQEVYGDCGFATLVAQDSEVANAYCRFPEADCAQGQGSN